MLVRWNRLGELSDPSQSFLELAFPMAVQQQHKCERTIVVKQA
jgi:hypothetical protein